MKIIEALKKIKDLQRKTADLRDKIGKHSAHLNYETPLYKDQTGQIKEWLQSHSDILKEILGLRVAIQKINISISVTIELGGKQITKTIAEWIHRRRDLATEECKAWQKLTDRGLREGLMTESTGEKREIKIVRCYDAAQRDKQVDLYSSEPSLIDAKLEIINAVTDIVE